MGGGCNCLSSQDPRDTSGPTQKPSEKENGVPTQRKREFYTQVKFKDSGRANLQSVQARLGTSCFQLLNETSLSLW